MELRAGARARDVKFAFGERYLLSKIGYVSLISTFNRASYVFPRIPKFECCVTWQRSFEFGYISEITDLCRVTFAFEISRVSSRFTSLIIIAMLSLRAFDSKGEEGNSIPRRQN